MTWLDRFRDGGSFRGVRFFVERHDLEIGRRLVPHEYPGRSLPFVEDLGRKARAFHVEAYILGDDYDLERDRMLAAVEEEGAGELVHPYLGRHRVTVHGFRLSERADEGRVCRLSIAFLEAGEAIYPAGDLDGGAATAAAALGAQDAATAGLGSRLNVTGKPAFVLDAIGDAAGVAEQYLSSLTYGGEAGPVRRLLDSVEGLADRAIDLATDPEALGGELTETMRRVRDGFPSKLDALRALDGMHELESPTPEGVGELQEEAAENGRAILDHLRIVSVAEQAILATELELESLDQAEELRGLLEGRLDELALRVGDLEGDALETLRGALGLALPPPDSDLPRLATVTPRRALPSLVLAYELWNDPARAGEIAARNRVRRPGFVPGGEPLEVLSA